MIMNFCTVLNNNRFTLCSAYWQQASKRSALLHFELIWKDKYAHQNNNNNNSNNNNNNNNNELKKKEYVIRSHKRVPKCQFGHPELLILT